MSGVGKQWGCSSAVASQYVISHRSLYRTTVTLTLGGWDSKTFIWKDQQLKTGMVFLE
jgi:hypothetical protein